MSRLKSGIWVSAFLRRMNDRGDFCVVAKKGDADAGQIWIEIDHLNGLCSLYSPAPANQDAEGREFTLRLSEVEPSKVSQRLIQEADFDPDFWHISIETRRSDFGLTIV